MGLPVGVDRCFVDKYYYGIIKGVDGADYRLLTGLHFSDQILKSQLTALVLISSGQVTLTQVPSLVGAL
jgi:hypothetical protein